MMEIPVLVYILLGILVVLAGFQTYYIRNQKPPETKDQGYLELKYRMQYHVFIFIVATSIVGFFGWGTYKELVGNIEANLTEKLKPVMATLDSISLQQDSLTRAQKDLQTDISNTISQAIAAKGQIEALTTNVSKYDKRLQQYRDIQVFYVKDILLPPDSIKNGIWQMKFRFDRLRTIDGIALPKFKEVPVIDIINVNNASGWLSNITSEDFVFHVMTSDYEADQVGIKFGIMVIDVAKIKN